RALLRTALLIVGALFIRFLERAIHNFWLAQRERLIVERRPARRVPELKQLFVKELKEELFQTPGMAQIAQNLRRRIPVRTRPLVVPAPVRPTVRRAGLSTPILGFHQYVPEYLVLIDQVNPRDLQANLLDALVDRLVENELYVTRYYFQGDPRACR